MAFTLDLRGLSLGFMNQQIDFHHAKALLEWHIELGATDAICDEPINRYEIPAKAPKAAKPADVEAPAAKPLQVDTIAEAERAAAAAQDLDALKQAINAFDHCALKRAARGLIFANGQPTADVMIVGEVSDRADEKAGVPFSGPSGVLLDKMFAAIGRKTDGQSPDTQIYAVNTLPWSAPQNRDPRPDEIAMMVPFLHRHIELAAPKIVVLMGNTPCQALLGKKGISRMRGTWETINGNSVLLMQHPVDLMQNPMAKRNAWNDLLALQSKLRATS